MFAHLSAVAAILAMLCAVFGGVIPNLAKEPTQSRALQAWLDIWLPLLLAIPIAAVPLLPGGDRLPPSLLLSTQSVIPVALAALLVGIALLDRRNLAPMRCIDGHHVLLLVLLGVLLVLASFMGRMADWSGHLLLTAAMLWLWTVSADPRPAPGSAPAGRDPVFLIDWTGPLKHPVNALVQGLLLLSPVLLLLAVLSPYLPQIVPSTAPGAPSLRLLAAVALLVPATQATLLARVWRQVGPAAAIRCSVSTIILTLLLGVGVMCVRFIPWVSLLMSVRTGEPTSYAMTDLTGVSVLFPSALLVLTLAIAGLTPLLKRRMLFAMGWTIAACSVVSLGIGLSLVVSRWPAKVGVSVEPTLESTDSTQSRESAPDFDGATFLQDHSI